MQATQKVKTADKKNIKYWLIPSGNENKIMNRPNEIHIPRDSNLKDKFSRKKGLVMSIIKHKTMLRQS